MHLVADLRYAWRSLRAAPVFTSVAVRSIALGIGANTAIFTLVDQVLLRLLPVKDPNLPVFDARTLDYAMRATVRNERLLANLSAVFGLLATLLAMIGLYGVLAYTVSRRTREIGIRMALGALRVHASWLVLREVLLLAGAGIAVALPVAWWPSRLVMSQLYNVAPMDPITIIVALATLCTVTLCAGLISTLRATRINPVRALRQE
jgi:ABC-type antimicrobial peptide transport system permease subunit